MLPIPLRDENPTSSPPVTTMVLIIANALVWVYEIVHGVTAAVFEYGLIPAWLLHGMSRGRLLLSQRETLPLIQAIPWPLSTASSMFVHASWMHIIGNMWFLWLFGDNLEDRMGRGRFAVFYLLCGLIAAAAQVMFMPNSQIPMVGASGAIAGVMGGYVLLYPHARIRCLIWIFVIVTTVRIPAWIWLGAWFLFQFLTPSDSGVAWMAHVGGFVGGLAFVHLFARRSPPPSSSVISYRYLD